MPERAGPPPGSRRHPLCLVVIGVSGTGKTTMARLLAERLDIPFSEADDLHPPANIAKMSAGIPLDDADRWPWLESIGRRLREGEAAGTGCVVACSALKRRYRDTLRTACPSAFFLHLTAERKVLEQRLGDRAGHFMPKTLLGSQLAALEPLQPDERGAALDVGPAPEVIAETAVALLPR
ncbi:gluconokinase [Streptomyces caeruleatus]|nr:gluconokinase [Streptomyces caeruleatus]